MSSEMTIPTDLELDNPLWRFAGSFWSRPVAKDACLALQADGWSVTDVLCALWLTSEAALFPGQSNEKVLFWRSQITERLRQVRKTIHKGNPVTDPVRNSVGHSELESEKVELALAYLALKDSVIETTTQFGNGTAKTLALKNLQAAAPEKTMDNKTGKALDTLADELLQSVSRERVSC